MFTEMEVHEEWIDIHVQGWRSERARHGHIPTDRGELAVARAARNTWNLLTTTDQEEFIGAADLRSSALATIGQLTGIGAAPDTNDTAILHAYYKRAWDLLVARRKLEVAYHGIIAIINGNSGPAVRTRQYIGVAADHNFNLAVEGLNALQGTLGNLPNWRPSRFSEIVNDDDPVRANDDLAMTAYLLRRTRVLEEQHQGSEDCRQKLGAVILDRRAQPGNAARRLARFLRQELRIRRAVRESLLELLNGLRLLRPFFDQIEAQQATIRALGPANINDRVQFQHHITLFEQLAAVLDSADHEIDKLLRVRTRRRDPATEKLEAHLVTKREQIGDANNQMRINRLSKMRNAYKDLYEVQEVQSLWLGNAVSPWELRRPIGAGSHGSVEAWVKVDHGGTILDRLAKKEATNYNPNDAEGASNCCETPGDMPSEVAAMYMLRPLRGSSGCVVQIRNWRNISNATDQQSQRFVLYMELCQRGDLSNVALLHLNAADRHQRNLPPEPFIWSVLDSLSDAGLLMQRGEIAGGRNPTSIWEQIVHGDMKHDNVVLDENNTGIFSGYPRAKLADFGIALLHPFGDPPRWATFGGATYRAPEAANSGADPPPGTKTNVFGVGIICRAIMNDDWMNPQDDIPWTDLARQTYTERLLDLVQDCLKDDPHARPSFDDIKRAIRTKSGSPRRDDVVEMRTAPADDPRFANAPVRTTELDIPLAMAREEDWMDEDPPGGPTGAMIGDPPSELDIASDDD